MSADEALSGRQFKAHSLRSKQVGAMTVHTGVMAEGQTGYRMVHRDELDPRPAIPGVVARGYRSYGKGNVGGEKHSRGSTMFSASPLSSEDMDRYGATHQVEVDVSGLPFRTLRQPQGDHVAADVGLGAGVTGEMKWDRIKRVTDRAGNEMEYGGHSSPGDRIAVEHMMDTGEHPRRGR